MAQNINNLLNSTPQVETLFARVNLDRIQQNLDQTGQGSTTLISIDPNVVIDSNGAIVSFKPSLTYQNDGGMQTQSLRELGYRIDFK